MTHGTVLVSVLLTCFVALAAATVLLLTVGQRLKVSSRILGAGLAVVVAAAAGEITARIWHVPSRYIVVGQALLLVMCLVVVAKRRLWNPIGQLFFGTFLASILVYLVSAATITFGGGLPFVAVVASFLLFLFELVALTISASFAFETCDVICRTRWARQIPEPDPVYLPKVSLQIAAYNEPPDMLIETIKSVEAIDYPNFELLVIDNNTKDPEVWRPVEEYCRDRPNVRFVHVDPWPGYKSGALNLALTEYTAPDAELVGVIDADYLVDPSYLRSVVGYFADPNLGFLQTPQDYREWEGDAYLTACYDAYRYFFATSMPSRNERNSIIFAGTMGLLRRSVLEEQGGWDEWCITEDAETSLRMLKSGYSGLYVNRSFGHGVMPLTFTSLKSQRFRWCFGGMQIMRRHWRELMPWNRDRSNGLTTPQRLDYLFSGLQWLTDLVNLGFTIVLLAMAALFVTQGEVTLRPLVGAAVLLPAALITSGLLRAVWALRVQTGISTKRALLAFANWLSLSWTVALGCLQGLTRKEGVFMRTPKTEGRNRLLGALWAARTETLLALVVWGAGAAVALTAEVNAFLVIVFFWQGLLYACSPFTSWLNQHTELSAQLERRQRSEERRERAGALRPYYAGATAGVAFGVAIALVVSVGGRQAPSGGRDPFTIPRASAEDQGPLSNVVSDEGTFEVPEQMTTTTAPEEEEESTTTTEATDTTTTTVSEESTTTAP